MASLPKIENLHIAHVRNSENSVQLSFCPDKEHKKRSMGLTSAEKKILSTRVQSMFYAELERAEADQDMYRPIMRKKDMVKGVPDD